MKKQQHINWDLAARVYSGEASLQEKSDFDMWLQDTEHRAEWNSISESLSKVDYTLISEKVDLEQAWNKVMNNTINKNTRVIRMWRTGMLAAAASIIVAVILFLTPSNNTTDEVQVMLTQTHNSIEQIDMTDGSLIDLNRNSSIEYPQSFASDQRLVSLKGEAFFDVAADSSRPFVISTRQIQIKVIGTSFNVKAFPNAGFNEVSVKSGIVEVSSLSNRNNTLVLKAGDKAIFNTTDHSWVKKQLSDENYIAWKTKKLAFKNQELHNAITLIEEVYDVSIEAPKDFNIYDKKISTTFDKYTIEHIMTVLDGIYGVQFNYQKN